MVVTCVNISLTVFRDVTLLSISNLYDQVGKSVPLLNLHDLEWERDSPKGVGIILAFFRHLIIIKMQLNEQF
jgi:hypothetical protein